MPNNGLADDTYGAFLYQGRYRTITVFVVEKGYYCSSLIGSSWRQWGPCDPRWAP